MVRIAVLFPTLVGMNVIVKARELFGSTLNGRVGTLVSGNWLPFGPVNTILETVSPVVPLLLSVTVFAMLLPTGEFPNDHEVAGSDPRSRVSGGGGAAASTSSSTERSRPLPSAHGPGPPSFM